MRRAVVSLWSAVLLSLVCLVPVSVVQEATPAEGFADLGLQELNVSVSAGAIEGVPASLAAGRYLLNVTAGEDTGFGGGVEFVQPAGVTPDQFIALMSPPDGETAPGAEEAASPAAGDEAALFESTYAGGVFAQAGTTTQGVIDLGPGQWIAHGGFETPQAAIIVEVTGEMPADLPEPVSAATLTMGEYVIEVTAGALETGTQVVKVENIGAQPHFIVAGRTSVAVTDEDVTAILEAEMTGTPAAVEFNPDTNLEDAFYTGVQSTGTTMWIQVDLQPGNHILLCYFPDLGDFMPHAYHGMFEIVPVDD